MLQVTDLQPSHLDYPNTLKAYWRDRSTPILSAIGAPELLRHRTTAIFCSVKCPGDLILKTYDLARNLRDRGVSTTSGFHSPMEKECLMLLLRGTQPVIYCPARSLDKMRLSKEQNVAIRDKRLLILSPFQGNQHRMSAALAQQRNQFVAAIADDIFIAYAASGSKTETLAQQIVAWKKPLLTFKSGDNQNLIDLGAQIIHDS
ncbi:MAG: DNA-binding protein [Leptolyngbya foveolarum]|uniref:DNA-binding protein n=1 Tax=Leptolyngbya foveolarum TaxID=47253 RepID=A0A2W4WID3_9CYAN|nr:MAG: DNA-binding protein [Leptolyngbya foveolarum]